MDIDVNNPEAKKLSHALAELRARAALVHIENAQRELGEACQNLSSIIGAIPDCNAVNKLYDRVHTQWHRLNKRLEKYRGRWQLDGVNLIAELKRRAERADGAP